MSEEYILPQLASEVAKAINNALNPDTALTESGKPADAGAVGEAIKKVEREVASGVTDAQIATAVASYLTAHPVSGLTDAQITALDEMFKIASYTADPTNAYAAFKTAFGLNGIVAEVTSLRGVQLPVVPSNFTTNENWQYSGNSGNLKEAIGSARYLYLGRVFTGTVYLRNVGHSPFAGNTACMHLVAEDYITNQTAEGEKLTATEEITQFNGTYLTVSQNGSEYEFTNDYSNGTLYGWVRLQRFDIPEGKYAVISAANGGDTVNNTKNVDGWFTAFFEDPTEHITITEVYE